MNESYVNFESVVQVKLAVKEFSTGYFPQGKPTVRFMIGKFREVVTAIEELVGCPNVSINTGKFIEQSASSSFSSNGLLVVTWLPSFAFKVLCSLLTHESLCEDASALVAEVVKKLMAISQTDCHPFITERASVEQDLIKLAMDELHLFGEGEKTLLSTTSPHEAEILLVLHALSLVASLIGKEKNNQNLPDAFLPQERDINASLLEKTFSLVLMRGRGCEGERKNEKAVKDFWEAKYKLLTLDAMENRNSVKWNALVVDFVHNEAMYHGRSSLYVNKCIDFLMLDELVVAAVLAAYAWVRLMLRCAKLEQLLSWKWPSERGLLKQQGNYFNMNYLAYLLNSKFLANGAHDNNVKEGAKLSGFCFVTFTEYSRKLLCTCISSHYLEILAALFMANGFIILMYSLNIIVGFFKPLPFRVQWIIAWSLKKWGLKNYSLLLFEVEIGWLYLDCANEVSIQI